MAYVWLNQKGYGVQDPNARRVINSHAAQIGRNRRRAKRENAVRLNQANKVKVEPPESVPIDQEDNTFAIDPDLLELENDNGNDTNLLRLEYDDANELEIPGNEIGNPSKMPTPLSMAPRHALIACHEWVTMILPSDGFLLGLSKPQTTLYGRELLVRAYENEIFLLGLALYRLCALPLAKVRGSAPRRIIDTMRARFMSLINQRLMEGSVDDVLIHSICCAIPVDDHLGLLEYDITHLRGLETLVELRGGFSEVGSSYESLADTLRSSVLHAMATTKLNMRRGDHTSSPQSSSPPDSPIYGFGYPIASCKVPIPQGFRILVDSGSLSSSMIPVVYDFQTWVDNLELESATTSPPWRNQIPDHLTDLEKTVFLGLICLADDLTCLGQHPCMDLWRKPRQRALQVLESTHLWAESRNADCLLWISTVVSLPNAEVPLDLWDQLQDRILTSRRDIATVGDVTHVLKCFFAPEPRLSMWKNRWHAKLSRPW